MGKAITYRMNVSKFIQLKEKTRLHNSCDTIKFLRVKTPWALKNSPSTKQFQIRQRVGGGGIEQTTTKRG